MITLKEPTAQVPATVNPQEIELLLCCARTRIDPETAERIRTLLQQDIHWTYLIQTATRHGVMPLLYRSLNATCPEAVPKSILSQLRHFFQSNALHNLLLTRELVSLLNLFNAHDIPAIPIKGSVLAVSVYGNLALRQFSDLDILVHKHNIFKAKDLLISQGYRLPREQETANIDQFEQGHAWQMMNPERHVSVDLHWSLVHQYFTSDADFTSEIQWENLESISLIDTTVPNLNSEDLLLFLCLHGTGEGWITLGRCCDLAELIRTHQDMDWKRILEQARKLHKEKYLFLGLLIASDVLGATIPSFVQETMEADLLAKWMKPRIKKWLLVDDSPVRQVFFRFFNLVITNHRQDRGKYFLRQFMNPNENDIAILPLPAFLSPLYCLIRPIRLLSKYGLSSLKYLLEIRFSKNI
ncbi:hypothetical protein NIES4074_66190 [Cylindrospermum sp. NIES-4074]|nr:hypothetical protein NIES4074_66190 [Cylindrospermum sp. NIES-4074]